MQFSFRMVLLKIINTLTLSMNWIPNRLAIGSKNVLRFAILLVFIFIVSSGSDSALPQTKYTDLFDQGNILLEQGKYREADQAFSQALQLSSNVASPQDKAIILYSLGISKIELAQYDAAYTYTEQAASILEANKLTHLSLWAKVFNVMAEIHFYKGEYAKAEPLYLRGIKAVEASSLPDAESLFSLTHNLAEYYRETAQFEKAKLLFDKALPLSIKHYGENSSETSMVLCNTGQYYHDLNDFNKAEALYKRSIAILKKIHKTKHPDYAKTLTTLGVLYKQTRQFDLAQTSYEEALEIKKQIYGAVHPEIAISLNNLGMLYLAKEDKERALAYFQEAKSMAVQFDGQAKFVQSINEHIKAYTR